MQIAGLHGLSESMRHNFRPTRRSMIFLERTNIEHTTDRLDRSDHAVTDL
jgi:hypothetical protein